MTPVKYYRVFLSICAIVVVAIEYHGFVPSIMESPIHLLGYALFGFNIIRIIAIKNKLVHQIFKILLILLLTFSLLFISAFSFGQLVFAFLPPFRFATIAVGSLLCVSLIREGYKSR